MPRSTWHAPIVAQSTVSRQPWHSLSSGKFKGVHVAVGKFDANIESIRLVFMLAVSKFDQHIKHAAFSLFNGSIDSSKRPSFTTTEPLHYQLKLLRVFDLHR